MLGWGGSFHFCRYYIGEEFNRAIARHEHYLASNIGIKANMRVLDVGCGVGGPAREIAHFTGAHITGLNNNAYQIQRATHYAAKELLQEQTDFVKVIIKKKRKKKEIFCEQGLNIFFLKK